MTPPNKVDIHSLNSLYLENLQDLDPNLVAKRFKGTDLVLDTETGELKKIGPDGTSPELTSIDQENAWIKTLREADGAADGKKDGYIDINEVKKLLSTLPPESSSTIDPEKFLDSIAKLMKDRYDPLAANMNGWKAELAFKPTLDALDLYNKGLLSAATQQAGETIAFNSLTKTTVNIVGFFTYPVRRIGGPTETLWGDMRARESAKKDYDTRQAVIERLKAAIDKGVAGGESWALQGDFAMALQQLDPADAELLNGQLAATKINNLLNLSDPKERYRQMMDFAKADLPGWSGFGTGNTSEGWFGDFWNYSGHRYNLFFARTVLRFLGTKAASGDEPSDDAMHSDARQTLSDSQGDGGGYTNLVAVGLTGIGCGLGYAVSLSWWTEAVDTNTCITEYRDWSDEDRMDALGRGIDGAIMVFGGSKFLSRLSEGMKLSGYKGVFTAEGVWGTWRAAMAESKWNWLAGGKWAEAASKAEREAELLGLAGKAAQEGRFWRLMNKLGESKNAFKKWIFKGLGELRAEQKAQAALQKGSAGMDKLSKGVILLGILQYGDNAISPSYNPFDYGLEMGWMDREADFERYPDPTQPDPTLSAASIPGGATNSGSDSLPAESSPSDELPSP